MAYSEDYRKGILKLLEAGHTLENLQETLGVSISAMEEWKRKVRNGEGLANKELKRKPRKFQEEELKKAVEEDCDITLEKLAIKFGGSISGAFDACNRYKITLKKKRSRI
jgi:transposase